MGDAGDGDENGDAKADSTEVPRGGGEDVSSTWTTCPVVEASSRGAACTPATKPLAGSLPKAGGEAAGEPPPTPVGEAGLVATTGIGLNAPASSSPQPSMVATAATAPLAGVQHTDSPYLD